MGWLPQQRQGLSEVAARTGLEQHMLGRPILDPARVEPFELGPEAAPVRDERRPDSQDRRLTDQVQRRTTDSGSWSHSR